MALAWHTHQAMASPDASLHPSLDFVSAARMVEARLREHAGLVAVLAADPRPAVRELVRLLTTVIDELNCEASVPEASRGTVTLLTLAHVEPILGLRSNRVENAAEGLVASWHRSLELVLGQEGASDRFGANRGEGWVAERLPSYALEIADQGDEERQRWLRSWLQAYLLALWEHSADAAGETRVRGVLRRLGELLKLSQADLGRMFAVSGETIRRWEAGKVRVPEERLAQLDEADAVLRRILDLVEPERLAPAIRREAGLFDGERALDWILRGRIRDVAERYEATLLYQA